MEAPAQGRMLIIPAGAFWRGSPEGVGLADERPHRRIELSAFEIDLVPVTFGDFAAFIEAGGYHARGLWTDEGWQARSAHVTGPAQPVCGVSFFEAQAYAAYTGKRLPTEAEWEKAARGTDGRLFPWGNEWEEGRCSVRGHPVRAAPAVGSFPSGASPYGAQDMAGGVWEWCADWYDAGYYASAPEQDPPGPPAGQLKVARGGAWNALPLQNRTANRNAWRPTARFSNLGFRCAR